jgi:hypothetical protein
MPLTLPGSLVLYPYVIERNCVPATLFIRPCDKGMNGGVVWHGVIYICREIVLRIIEMNAARRFR